MDRRKSALKMFFGMLTNTFRRQQLWSLLPMDPAAWYFMLTQHQAELTQQQAQTLATATLVTGPSKPMQAQGVSKHSRAYNHYCQDHKLLAWTSCAKA